MLPVGFTPLIGLVDDWRIAMLAVPAVAAWLVVLAVMTTRTGVVVRHNFRVVYGSTFVMLVAGQVAVVSGGRLWVCVTASGFSFVAVLVVALDHRADAQSGTERDGNPVSLRPPDM